MRSWLTSAAFFDLDRTLLAGASGPVLTEALRKAGVVSGRTLPGEGLVYRVFDTIGETLPSMALARQAAALSKGRVRAKVQAAATDAADVLVGMIQPFAKDLFAEHRAAGRQLVLATTTPYDMVKPLADALGLRRRRGHPVRRERRRHLRRHHRRPVRVGHRQAGSGAGLGERNGVDLAESWVYSDSVYDTPLLSAVGHPVVVNPDPRMVFVAMARRWPRRPPRRAAVACPSCPSSTSSRSRWRMAFARPELVPYARFDIAGVEHIPKEGPAIVVGNHRSLLRRHGHEHPVRPSRSHRALPRQEGGVRRPGRRAGRPEAFGGIRVDRGTGSDEPLQAAAAALEAGQVVAIMPQGTIPRGRAFFDPVLKGRWGAARLARLTKAPVIPVGLWGTEKVWPRSSRLPNVLNVANPPLVRVRVGSPVELKYASVARDTDRIMAAIVDLLPPEAHERHEPTGEELGRTYPPGYRGDPNKEHERRPGTD